MLGDKLLEVRNLKMYFRAAGSGFGKGSAKAVDDISFSVEKGQTFGLVGESGCGKTTTGKCILRMNKPTSGHIFYKGQDLATMTDSQLKPIRRQIQLIFQDPYGSFDPRQSAGAILKDAITGDGKRRTRMEIDAEVSRYLKLVELLPSMADRYPHELSGGQRQRLGIARALACNPELIVCDEPVSALDVSIQAQIIKLIKDLQKEFGYTIVFITHDLGVVANVADRVAVLYAGQIVELGTVEEVYYDPHHPYTWALLSSLPQLMDRGMKLYSIAGTPPSLYNDIVGDAFAPRNPYCLRVDTLREPPMFKVSDTHYAKTWLLDPRAPKVEKPDIIRDIHGTLMKVFNI